MEKHVLKAEEYWRFVYVLPNLITGFGLLVGLYVLFDVAFVEGKVGDDRLVLGMLGLLIVAGVADVCDGALARALRAQTRFGLVFDSMSDAVSFGLAPALLSLKTVDFQEINSRIALGCALFYALCGILRLTRYSSTCEPIRVSKDESEEGAQGQCSQKMTQRLFVGLPIPAACSALVSLNLLLLSLPAGIISKTFSMYAVLVALILLGLLMISRWYFPALSFAFLKNPLFKIQEIALKKLMKEKAENSPQRLRVLKIMKVLRFFKEDLSCENGAEEETCRKMEDASTHYLFSKKMFFLLPIALMLVSFIFSWARGLISQAGDFEYQIALVLVIMTWGYVFVGWIYACFFYCAGNLERSRAPKTCLVQQARDTNQT